MNNLLAGTSPGITKRDDLCQDKSIMVGQVALDDAGVSSLPRRFRSRNNALLAAALGQIRNTVESVKRQYGDDSVAVLVGSSTSGMDEGGRALSAIVQREKWPAWYEYELQTPGNPSQFAQWLLGLRGPAYTIATACSSGAKVFASGARLLRQGVCKAVVVAGVDSLCPLTANGFAALDALALSFCRPFAADRDGLNLGEGAAAMVMVAEELGEEHIRLLGYGESSDGYHICAPEPDGLGVELAIRQALNMANIQASQLDYVNLHGTGTRQNDAMEARLANRIYGANLALSSTKKLTGHTLGAAGAIEAALAWLLLSSLNKRQHIPGQVGDYEIDPELAPVNLIRDWHPIDRKKSIIGSHSLAFGGNNTMLILGGEDA